MGQDFVSDYYELKEELDRTREEMREQKTAYDRLLHRHQVLWEVHQQLITKKEEKKES
jgi:hypothetical protein